MTERQQIERLMAIALQMREAQRVYFKNRKNASAEHVKNLSNDARIKGDSLDNLLKQLQKQGYNPDKHIKIEQQKIF